MSETTWMVLERGGAGLVAVAIIWQLRSLLKEVRNG
ncbi:unnamed protein product, partial [marine sediment metagenome]